MNKTVNIFGKTIPAWFLIMGVVAAGSMAIATAGGATHMEDPPDIQHTSDVKIHLQDVDGKINTNVPIAASRAFSPLPVEFDEDIEPTVADAVSTGSTIETKQKVIVNFVLDVSEDATTTFTINNRSEDTQIFLIKANAPPHVILDMESGTGVTIHGLSGHNEWIASVNTGGPHTFKMETSTTDAGFYPIVVELLRVG